MDTDTAFYDAHPETEALVEELSGIDVGGAEVVLAPEDVFDGDTFGEGSWVGAPVTHAHDGETYLAVRERTPDERGRAVTLYREDGFEPVKRITADAMGAVSLEEVALATTGDGLFRCYLPVEHGENDWTIQVLDDVEEPADLEPGTARNVLEPDRGTSDQETVKDPVVRRDNGGWTMYYAGSSPLNDGVGEQAHRAVSTDGKMWEKEGVVLGWTGWRDHHTRVAEVLPADDGELLVYEGSGEDDYGNTWNLRTGFAYREDGDVNDLTPNGPVLSSPVADAETGLDTFGTCRYLALTDDHVYMEVAREDGAFELRRAARG